MHSKIEEMPLEVDVPVAKVRSQEAGEMTMQYARVQAGADLAPLLEGLPGDKCSCPHWGHVFRGALIVNYADGSEETIRAGESYYLPAGHTIRFDTETHYIDLSPTEEMKAVSEHMERKMSAV